MHFLHQQQGLALLTLIGVASAGSAYQGSAEGIQAELAKRADEPTISCPDSDQQVVTGSASGRAFKVFCDSQASGYTEYDAPYVDNDTQCLGYCDSAPQCIAATSEGGYQCHLMSFLQGGNEGTTPQVGDTAFLINNDQKDP